MRNTLPLISVIVPVYNVEMYLQECVDSILAQTYKHIEVILVNDGSLDKCGKICDENEKRDSRVIVLHMENQGVSSARNVGIEAAKGEYITFVDADDYIENDMLELLWQNITEHQADISCCGFYIAYKNFNKRNDYSKKTTLLYGDKAIEEFLIGRAPNSFVVGKLYKKLIFRKIRFPTDIAYCEDVFVTIEALLESNTIVCDTAPKYYYRQRKSSVVHENYCIKKLDVIKAAEHVLERIEENHTRLCNLTREYLLKANMALFQYIVFAKNYQKMFEYKKTLSILRNNFNFIMCSKNFTKNQKVKAAAIKASTILYKVMQWVYDRRKERVSFD